MRARIAIATFAAATGACGGGGSTLPRTNARLQLVSCDAAPAPPTLLTWQPLAEEPYDLVGNGWSRKEKPTFGGPAAAPASPVLLGTVQVLTPRDVSPERIQSVLQAHVGDLETCFRQGMRPNSMMKAVISWTLRIDPNGRVTTYMPQDLGFGDASRACFAQVVQSLAFPRARTEVAIRVPVMFDSDGLVKPPSRPPRPEVPLGTDPWTPFAAQDGNPDGVANIARITEAAVRTRLTALENCFAKAAGPSLTGSVRALLELTAGGEVIGLRAGGLGDRAVEQCFVESLASLRVVSPAGRPSEIACDFARGEAEPWRVAPADSYQLVTVSKTELRHGTQRIVLDGTDPAPLDPAAAALIVLDPDAPGSMISLALGWVNQMDSAVIALRDHEPSPRYLAMGRTSTVEPGLLRDPDVLVPMLRLGKQNVTACLGRAAQDAALIDHAAVSTLVGKLASKCKQPTCAPTLVLSIDGDAVASDLLELTSTARRHGFDKVLLGATLDCAVPE